MAAVPMAPMLPMLVLRVIPASWFWNKSG